MGTWGAGPFDNDDAADFVGDLVDTADPGQVLDASLASGAASPAGVAAACIVAARLRSAVLTALSDHDGEGEELSDWLDSGPFEVTDDRRRRAIEIVGRVLADCALWDDPSAAERATLELEPFRRVLGS